MHAISSSKQLFPFTQGRLNTYTVSLPFCYNWFLWESRFSALITIDLFLSNLLIKTIKVIIINIFFWLLIRNYASISMEGHYWQRSSFYFFATLDDQNWASLMLSWSHISRVVSVLRGRKKAALLSNDMPIPLRPILWSYMNVIAVHSG